MEVNLEVHQVIRIATGIFLVALVFIPSKLASWLGSVQLLRLVIVLGIVALLLLHEIVLAMLLAITFAVWISRTNVSVVNEHLHDHHNVSDHMFERKPLDHEQNDSDSEDEHDLEPDQNHDEIASDHHDVQNRETDDEHVSGFTPGGFAPAQFSMLNTIPYNPSRFIILPGHQILLGGSY